MRRLLPKSLAVALVFALLAPSMAAARPNPPASSAIRDRIIKRGVGAWVCVEQKNGLILAGRITGLDDQSFGLQLHNYPEITVVNYSDVVRVRNLGLSGKAAAFIIAAGVGGSVAMALIAHHEFEVNKAKMPTLPSPPVFP